MRHVSRFLAVVVLLVGCTSGTGGAAATAASPLPAFDLRALARRANRLSSVRVKVDVSVSLPDGTSDGGDNDAAFDFAHRQASGIASAYGSTWRWWRVGTDVTVQDNAVAAPIESLPATSDDVRMPPEADRSAALGMLLLLEDARTLDVERTGPAALRYHVSLPIARVRGRLPWFLGANLPALAFGLPWRDYVRGTGTVEVDHGLLLHSTLTLHPRRGRRGGATVTFQLSEPDEAFPSTGPQ